MGCKELDHIITICWKYLLSNFEEIYFRASFRDPKKT